MENAGYLIVLKPEVNLRNWEIWRKEDIEKERRGYQRIRKAFSRFDPCAYRGISREPLDAYESLDPKEIEDLRQSGVDMDMNREARIRMRVLLRDKLERFAEDEDQDLFDELEQAVEVYGLLENRHGYEIIHVRREIYAANANTLGYDVGYLGGDHFSLIADTIVIPTWHPPVPEDYKEVAFQLSCLNENLLFDSVEEAAIFYEYYMSKDWAETGAEAGEVWEYEIIQVDEVKVGDR